MIYKNGGIPVITEFISYFSSIRGRSARTCSEYAKELAHFANWLDSDLLPDDCLLLATRKDINAYIAYCSEIGNSAATRARKISTLRAYYSWALDAGVVDACPVGNMPRPTIPKSLPRYLSLADAKLMIQSARQWSDIWYRRRNTCMLLFFLCLGLRLSELTNIDLVDIYDDVILINGKGNKERFVALPPSCLRALRMWFEKRGKDPGTLFVSKKCAPLSPAAVYSVIHVLLKQCGLANRQLSPHKLRHTCATLMYRAGAADIRLLQAILGHSSIATTERYTHIVNDQMVSAMRKHPLAEF